MKKLLSVAALMVLGTTLLDGQSLTREVVERIKQATVFIQVYHRFPLTEEESSG